MKAALYARFSTDKQSDHSIADQLRVCERLATTHRLAQLKRLVAEGILSQEEAAPAMDRLRPTETPEPYPFGAADAYREVVRSLRVSLEAEDIAAARPLLRDLIGPITAVPTESDGERYLTAHFPAFSVEGRLVAGAGFEPATFGL